MIARTITIDKTRCNGCGLCVKACHEGAMALVDGKAELVKPNLCDGLGDSLRRSGGLSACMSTGCDLIR